MGKVNALRQQEITKIEHDYCDGLISGDDAADALRKLGVDDLEIEGTLDAIDEYNERGDGGQFGLGA